MAVLGAWTFVFFLISSIIHFKSELLNDLDNPTGFSNLKIPPIGIAYDFIVVGGGTTGSVIARRLTDDPTINVLLIEAGSDGSSLFDIPVGMAATMMSGYDWMYRSEAEPTSCLGMTNGECILSRGKTLGGSSTLNALIYVRGNKKDFENWEAMGNKGWGYKDVLPYFKKLENLEIPEYKHDEEFHGTGGPITVSFPNHQTDISKAWLAAGQEMGFGVVDYNGENQTGFARAQMTYKNGRRQSAAKSYLTPVRHRPNLKVLLNSVVSKILIANKQAFGVEFIRQGRTFRVYAKKEVILSSGAFSSPQILMLSGIGPKEDLEKLGIDVIKDLPVGKKMESHVTVGGIVYGIEKPISLLMYSVLQNISAYKEYFFKGSGPLSAVPIEAIAFVSTPMNEDKDWPDVELELATFNFLTADGGEIIPRVLGLRRDVIQVYEPLFNKHSVHATLYVNRPKSRGKVKLRSSNPMEHPYIFRNWFKEKEDIDRTVQGIRILQKVMDSKPFKDIGAYFFPSILPGCEHLEPFSDDYWECHIRTFSWTRWHETGTCRMGPENDPDAVVDPELKVYGIKGLRVADASIFPKMVSGNTQGTCYMVGEKVSDLMKRQWLLKS